MIIRDVAVVIVSYRSLADLPACLEALGASRFTRFRVVIVENGGAEAHAALLAALPRTLAGGQPVDLVLAPGNLGFAGGCNLGIRHAGDADAYWLLNPDTEPSPGALAALVARLERGDCAAAGSELLQGDGRSAGYGGIWHAISGRAESFGHGAPGGAVVDADAIERRTNYITGASMLVARDFIARCGLMREDYFLYCEEVEWCLRARRLGLRLGFATGAPVVHISGTATGAGNLLVNASRLSVYLKERNRLLLTRDVYGALLLVTAPVALVHIAARYLKRAAFRQLGYALQGWAAGVRGERGPPGWLAAPDAR